MRTGLERGIKQEICSKHSFWCNGRLCTLMCGTLYLLKQSYPHGPVCRGEHLYNDRNDLLLVLLRRQEFTYLTDTEKTGRDGRRNLLLNTSLKVNSEEAIPGCRPSRQISSVQCLCSFAHLNLFFLLASLRYDSRPASRSRLFRDWCFACTI